MSKRKRRRFTGDEKVKILKRHLLEGESIPVVCKEFTSCNSVLTQFEIAGRFGLWESHFPIPY